MSKEIRQAITEICQGIDCKVVYIGKQNREGWECDALNLILGGESFEYYQGTGHSCKIYSRGRNIGFGQEKIAGLKFKRDTEKEGYTVFSDSERWIKKPHLADLLYSVIQVDSRLSEESFEDFCGNCGYDTDSRKALEIYLKCQENGSKLRKILKHDKWVICQEILQDY